MVKSTAVCLMDVMLMSMTARSAICVLNSLIIPVHSLDLSHINVEQYTYMNVNITGFRMIDPETQIARKYLKKNPQRFLKGKSNPLYSQNALMFDAVNVLAKALDNLDSLHTIHPMSLRQF